jgi:single-strand DNA-binding protein
MTDQITLIGLVATDPRHIQTGDKLSITSFRLASSQRRFDRAKQEWVDGDTNWYTITTFRQLAINVAASLKKGERVVVTGRLRIRDWENGEKSGTTVDIEADAVGHDLSWGSTLFSRTISSSQGSSSTASTPTPAGDAGDFPPAADLQPLGQTGANEPMFSSVTTVADGTDPVSGADEGEDSPDDSDGAEAEESDAATALAPF